MSNYVLQNSLDVSPRHHDFSITQKRNLRVSDNNNGNYASNSVMFDLATISNSNMYASWAETVVTIPITITVTNNTGTAFADIHKYVASLKNGSTNLIDGFNVYLSNQPVIGYQRMNPAKVAYELATTWSNDDWARGMEWGAFFEDGKKVNYSSASTEYSQASIASTTANVKARVDATVVSPTDPIRSVFCPALSDSRKELSLSTQTSEKIQTIQLNARINLSHLDDYFRKCPLTKNSLYRMEFFINTASFSLTGCGAVAAAAPAAAYNGRYTGCSAVTTSYGFNPIQIGNFTSWAGADAADLVATNITVAMTLKNDFLSTCVMDIPLYELSPECEKIYLSNSVKTFNYNKVMYQKLNAIDAGKPTGTLLISNGCSRARKLVLLPCYEYATFPSNDLVSPYSSFGSAFLSSPYAAVQDFNVMVSGLNIFNTNLNTPVEFFTQFKRETLNNGVDSAVLNSSMIDLSQYKSQYGAIVVDLTMNSKEKDDDLSKSYSVTFTNASTQRCSYLAFLFYECVLSVDAEAGNIILNP